MLSSVRVAFATVSLHSKQHKGWGIETRPLRGRHGRLSMKERKVVLYQTELGVAANSQTQEAGEAWGSGVQACFTDTGCWRWAKYMRSCFIKQKQKQNSKQKQEPGYPERLGPLSLSTIRSNLRKFTHHSKTGLKMDPYYIMSQKEIIHHEQINWDGFAYLFKVGKVNLPS